MRNYRAAMVGHTRRRSAAAKRAGSPRADHNRELHLSLTGTGRTTLRPAEGGGKVLPMLKNTKPSTESASNRSPWIWFLTLAVAGLPVIFGLYQIWIFFDEAFPHLYWSRTLPSLAAVALGIVGIIAPLWVWMKRISFRRWSRARQAGTLGGVLLVMSFVYILPFLLLIEAGRNSRAILPYIPAVILSFSKDGEDLLRWGVLGGPGTGHGSGGRSASGSPQKNDILVEWHAPLEPMDLPGQAGPDPMVHLRAEGSLDPIRLEVQIESGRTVLFKALGFRNAVVRQESKLVTLPTKLNPGTHRFTIEAAP
jgi:hypothetical protein